LPQKKKRFSYDETGTKIRANQGHSVEIDLNLKPIAPPAKLYHGTATRFIDAIMSAGLLKMARHHVHLSLEKETARTVGARHGVVAMLEVDSGKMAEEGLLFFCSENEVWLTEFVAPKYLKRVE
jgi:putative RNA 2'-phosphotransferase